MVGRPSPPALYVPVIVVLLFSQDSAFVRQSFREVCRVSRVVVLMVVVLVGVVLVGVVLVVVVVLRVVVVVLVAVFSLRVLLVVVVLVLLVGDFVFCSWYLVFICRAMGKNGSNLRLSIESPSQATPLAEVACLLFLAKSAAYGYT